MKRIGFGILLLLMSSYLFSQSGTISGRVVDEQGKAIADVTVSALNANRQTRTVFDGTYSLNNLSPGKYIVAVSSEAYAGSQKEVIFTTELQGFDFVLKRIQSTLEDLVVTAQKREEVLQKAPVSVTALGAKQVEEYRLWDIKELTAIAPSLLSADPGDKRNVTSVRGIVSTSYNPAVATYIDGVNQFNLDTYMPLLFDVERVEVLRGPQGTLYGRNAMGGVINIITKKPINRTEGFLQLSVGNYGQQRYSGSFRKPLVKDKLYFGAAGLYEKNDGLYTNSFNNSRYDRRRSVAGNYYLRFIANEKWSFSLNTKHNQNQNKGPFPLAFSVDEAVNNPFKLNQNALTKMADNSFNSSVTADYRGTAIYFTSQTSYQSNYRFYTKPIDADFSPLDAISIINNFGKQWNKAKVFTQEFSIGSHTGNFNPLKWSAGSYLFHQNSPVKQQIRFGEDAQMVGAPDKNFSTINSTKNKSNGAAFYGELRFAATNKLEIIAGLRYDYEKQEQQVIGEYQKDPDPNPAFAYRTDTVATASFTAVSPKITLAYNATANNAFFITYNRGFRAGGLTPLSSDPDKPVLYPFQPEHSNNIEAGFKNVFYDRRLILNVSVYHIAVTDAQVPTLVLPDAVTITKNTGSLRSKGIEAEVRSVLFKGLLLDYSFGYADARYQNLRISQNGTETDLKGKRQVFTPDITSMTALQYSHAFGKTKGASFVVRGEWKYLGTHYFDLANTIRQSPYNLLNTRFGVSTKKFDVMLWGRNLANKQYIGYAYDFGAAGLGNPRMLGISVTGRF